MSTPNAADQSQLQRPDAGTLQRPNSAPLRATPAPAPLDLAALRQSLQRPEAGALDRSLPNVLGHYQEIYGDVTPAMFNARYPDTRSYIPDGSWQPQPALGWFDRAVKGFGEGNVFGLWAGAGGAIDGALNGPVYQHVNDPNNAVGGPIGGG